MQAIVIYSNLSLDKNKRWWTVGGLAHSREGLGLVRPPLPSRHWESLLPCWLACIMLGFSFIVTSIVLVICSSYRIHIKGTYIRISLKRLSFCPSTASLRLRAEVPTGQRTLMAVPRSQ